jgi:hypothetical protein
VAALGAAPRWRAAGTAAAPRALSGAWRLVPNAGGLNERASNHGQSQPTRQGSAEAVLAAIGLASCAAGATPALPLTPDSTTHTTDVDGEEGVVVYSFST